MEFIDKQVGIYLRPIKFEDTDIIIKWRNSEDVRKNFIYQELFTRQIHENWIHTKLETGQAVQMIICDLISDEMYGSVYVRDIDLKHKKAEYGIFIGEKNARGRGVGTAAAKLMLKYCFEELKLHRVYLRLRADNIQALKSYENAGFIREGYLREDVCINGKYVDIIWMGITRDDYEKIMR